ncbi:hypothetical protein GR11A_00100 [Vibrio phage vB_VcorM_GR11A]|nr:hypothetical protein GR11A_00100 [Vibrio phage vB_VcorM_GR11A]
MEIMGMFLTLDFGSLLGGGIILIAIVGCLLYAVFVTLAWKISRLLLPKLGYSLYNIDYVPGAGMSKPTLKWFKSDCACREYVKENNLRCDIITVMYPQRRKVERY